MSGTSFYKTVYDYAIPAPAAAQCNTDKNTYNKNYTDTNTALTSLKGGTCLPDDIKYAEELEVELREKEALLVEYQKQKAIFDSYIESVKVLQNAKGPIDTFMKDLSSQQSALESEQYALQQKIRAGRRRFLDAEPQAGVSAILGLQTIDDKILLAFWICFLVGISVLATLFLLKYGAETPQQNIVLFLGILLTCAGIAFFSIRWYA